MNEAKADDVFRFPSATKRDPAVEAWLAAQAGDLGSIARTWFAQIRKCGKDVRELMHDGCPVACVGDAAFAYVNVFKAHVNVGFFQGASLDDPFDLLTGTGKRMRHVKLRPEVPSDGAALSRLIEDAYAEMKGR
jgi:hypothetical protein